MKKLFALLALVLGVVSCMKDQSFEAGLAGDGNFVLSVALPSDATRAAGQNSALGAVDNNVLEDGYQVRYTLEVYDANGNLAKEDQKIINETFTTFALRLIPGRNYNFVVWADFVKDGVAHYDVEDLRDVKLLGEHNAMDESRDAYTAVEFVEGFNSASTISMELIRPFAKLRIVTNDMDELYTEAVLKSGKVAYTKDIYTAFNALAGSVKTDSSERVTKEFNYNDATSYTEAAADEKTLFVDYLFGAEDNFVTFTFDVNDEIAPLPQITFNTNIPVQRNYLTTIYGPILTDANEVSVEIKDAFDGEYENNVGAESKSVEESLKKNSEVISIDLTDDVALNGNGVKWGGKDTKLIIIDGQNVATRAAAEDYTLTFNTTYRLHIETVNPDAKVILRNLNVTTNKESGTWDIYDIQFNCNVDIENVNFQKAIAFVKAGQTVTMKNVTISESHDYYAMWISAVGQTVNIDNLVVNSEGRGIKIDEQYVSAPAKVTLNVKDATFKTAKKAAIVVKSVAGADITLSNVDIADVAADTANAVWVDEDASAYFDKVNVVGGSMAIEGENTIEGENAQATFADAVKEANAVVQLAAGEYAIPANIAEGVTIICQQGTVFNNPSKMNLNGATVIGAKFNSDNGSIVNSGQVNGTFKNCVFEGKNVFRYGYVGKTCVFEDCHFKENGSEWVFHFDGVGTGVTNAEIICRRCTFDGKRVAIAGVVKNIVMEDCEVINGSYLNTYCNATFTGTKFNTSIRPLGAHAIYNNCEYYGNALKFENLSLYSGYDCKITVDDVDYAIASSVANLENYVNNATRDINVYITKTLTSKDATLKQKENVNVYITSYGDKKSFSAATLYIHGGSRSDGAETMTFENIHFSSFATRDLISSNSTASAERYAHNLTFKNCSFEGDNGIDVVGLRLRQTYNITIENCETRNLHSLGQLTSTYGLTVKNTTVNAFRGFNLLTTAVNTVFDGVTIDATKEDGYGIRVDAAAGGDVTIKNSTIIAYEPLVLRNAQAGFVLNMENNNTITANGEYQLVINGETPTLNGADDLTKNI